MPLSREEFEALYNQGMSVERIAAMDSAQANQAASINAAAQPRHIPRLMEAIPMVAGAVGGIGGAFAGGPVGGAIGGAGGSALGDLAKYRLAYALGYDVPPMGEQLMEAGTGAVIGGALSGLGGIAGNLLRTGPAKKAMGALGKIALRRAAAPVREGIEAVEDVKEVAKSLRPASAPAAPKATPKPKAEAKPARPARKSQAMRGASRPALARRTAARAQAVGREPAMPDNLEAQLRASVGGVRELVNKAAGRPVEWSELTPEQQRMAQQALRQLLGQ